MAQPTQTNTFTSGPILLPFIRFTLPILLSMFLQALYSAVDLIVISHYCSPAEIAAVAAGGNVMYMIQVVVTGLAMGVTVAIGRYIGEGSLDDAARSTGSSICVFTVFGLLLTALMLMATPSLIRIMDMPPEAYQFAVDYLMICSGGILFLVGYNLISCIFRGIGNAVLPLVFVIIAATINVAGDIILVTQYNMGVRGVAIATVCAQAISVILSILIIRIIKLPFPFSRKHIRFDREKSRELFSIGTPVALKDLVTQFSFLAVNAIANGMGVLLSAGYGIAWKVVSFVLLIPISFMQSMSAFIADSNFFHAVHVRLYCPEYGRPTARPGKKDAVLCLGRSRWHRFCHILCGALPQRSPGRHFHARCGRDRSSGRLSQGILHRLHPGRHSVLLHGLFQRLLPHPVCLFPGLLGWLDHAGARGLLYEPVGGGAPVPCCPGNPHRHHQHHYRLHDLLPHDPQTHFQHAKKQFLCIIPLTAAAPQL